jgi:hypothetical protein
MEMGMKDIICSFCGETMEAEEKDVVILPVCEKKKIRRGKDGNFFSKLHPVIGNLGSYLSGIGATLFRCKGCGHIAIFEIDKEL